MSDVLQGARTKDYVKEDIPGIENSGDKLRYVTLQDVQGKRAAMDVVIHGITVVSTGHTIDAGSARRLIKSTAHGARVGYFIRPTTGNSIGEEIPVIKIIDADTLVIAALFDIAIGDTFELIRPVTPNYTASGDLNVVVAGSGPVQFNKDGVTVTVNQDTVTPNNSLELPVADRIGNTLLSAIATDIGEINTDLFNLSLQLKKELSEFLFKDYTGVSNAGYTELIGSTASTIKSMTWFESSGFPMVVAVGGAGSEVDLFVVPPGGFNGEIPVNIPMGSRVSIKELVPDSISASSFIAANFYK